jgi:hypothetical protein
MALRSSLHIVKGSGAKTTNARKTSVPIGNPLPPALLVEEMVAYDLLQYDVTGVVVRLLQRCGADVGTFLTAGADPTVAARTSTANSADAANSSTSTSNSNSTSTSTNTSTSNSTNTSTSTSTSTNTSTSINTPPTSPNTPPITATRPKLEHFQMDPDAWRSADKGAILTAAVLADDDFLQAYQRLVQEVLLPQLKARCS